MSDVYAEAFYHLIWATTRREPMVTERVEALLYPYLCQKCIEKKAFVYAVGGMPDHVHLVCSIPPAFSVSNFVKIIKGSTSHYINEYAFDVSIKWQRGYGYLTLAKHDLPDVIAYVENQKTRHAEDRLWPKLERLPSETNSSEDAS